MVGHRVVVRHLLPDGRATDVLGVCTAWGELVTIRPDSGGPDVTVPRELIVTGKPVPPRASLRARVPARDIERRAFADWPEVEREPLGEWVVRSAPPMGGRLLKRANSVLAMGDPGCSLAEAGARVVAACERLGRTPLAQVERGGEIAAGLLDLGWTPYPRGESATQVASLAHVARRLPAAPADVVAQEAPTRLSVTLSDGSAQGAATLDGEWLCVHSLAVLEEHRRQGRARLVLAELLDWGAAAGAQTVWLHVEVDNVPALALYGSLGFRSHHENRYLTR